MKNLIIQKCEELSAEGLSISSVRATPKNGTILVSISINTFVPLGEGSDLPRHRVTIDHENCPKSVKIYGKDRYPNEEFELPGNEEQAEAYIRDLAKYGKSNDVARFGDDWVTKPNRWFFSKTTDGHQLNSDGKEINPQ